MKSSGTSGRGIVYINGDFFLPEDAKISIFDQGLIFGDAVFDTLVEVNGYVFRLDEHIDRLCRSAKSVKIIIPMDKGRLKEAILETVRRSGLKDAYVKCIVTRGVSARPVLGRGDIANPTLIVFAVPPVSVVSPEKVENGAKLISTAIRRPPRETLDPRTKSTNYQANMLMRMEAIAAGADEVISYDEGGFITECGAANIFLVKDHMLKTPSGGILEGITRETVIEIAKEIGWPSEVTDLARYDIYNADEVFLCSTAGGIFPVTDVDGVKIGDGRVGPTTWKIIERYNLMLREGVHGTQVYR